MERCFDSGSLKVGPFQIAAVAKCFIQDFIKLPVRVESVVRIKVPSERHSNVVRTRLEHNKLSIIFHTKVFNWIDYGFQLKLHHFPILAVGK